MRDLACGRKARRQDQVHDLLIGDLTVRLQQVQLVGLAAYRVHIETGTVVSHVNDHLRTFAMQPNRQLSCRGLAVALANIRLLDPMHHGIPEHVLERRQHLVEYLPVQLTRSTFDRQLSPFAFFIRHLPDKPCETRHVALERHHTRAHQAVLQLGGYPGLLHEEAFRLCRYRLQQILDAIEVVGRFRQCARELLNRRITVEFERVEVLGNQGFLVSCHDLRLGLDLELAQLLSQTCDRLFEFLDVKLDRADLLAQARVVDADLARRI